MRPSRVVPDAAPQTPDSRHARIFTLFGASRNGPEKSLGNILETAVLESCAGR
jgi:hypothetical protein